MKKNIFQVAAFYRFTNLLHLENLQESFFQFLSKQQIKGTILLASEGINGTVAGSKISIEAFRKFLDKKNLLSPSDFKVSSSEIQIDALAFISALQSVNVNA